MRANTVVPRRVCQKKKGEISKEDFNRAKRTRLCGDLSKLCNHVRSLETVIKPLVCAWCGLPAYANCMTCEDDKDQQGIPLHLNPTKERAAGTQCFFKYHDEVQFGLGKNDQSRILNLPKKEWIEPTARQVRDNKTVIEAAKEA